MLYEHLHRGQEQVDSHSLGNVGLKMVENGLLIPLLEETVEDGQWNVVEEIT
jgi:hypothetical protein